MPLVKAKCTSCGATLQTDNTRETMFCEYCGSKYIVEQAINNYNYNITNNITAEKVVIAGKGDEEKERLLKNAKTYERFGNKQEAIKVYEQVTQDYPDDYRGWMGLVRIQSSNYTDLHLFLHKDKYLKMTHNVNNALLCTIDTETREKIKSEWREYSERYAKELERQKSGYESTHNKTNAQIEALNNSINETERQIKELESKYSEASDLYYKLYRKEQKSMYKPPSKSKKRAITLLIIGTIISAILSIMGLLFCILIGIGLIAAIICILVIPKVKISKLRKKLVIYNKNKDEINNKKGELKGKRSRLIDERTDLSRSNLDIKSKIFVFRNELDLASKNKSIS